MGNFEKRGLDSLVSAGSALDAAPTASAAVTLYANQERVRVTIPATGTGIIYLPSVSEAAGRIYTLRAVARAGSYSNGEVSVYGAGADIVSDNMTAVNDYVIAFCDGFNWYVLKEVTT